MSEGLLWGVELVTGVKGCYGGVLICRVELVTGVRGCWEGSLVETRFHKIIGFVIT